MNWPLTVTAPPPGVLTVRGSVPKIAWMSLVPLMVKLSGLAEPLAEPPHRRKPQLSLGTANKETTLPAGK